MITNPSKRVVVTVGVSEARILGSYVYRFTETFKKFAGATCIIWQKEWPPGSPAHREVNYAFKVHALKHAASKGFTSLLWCDASCYAVAPLDPVWERLERDGHILMNDANKMGNWSSDASLAMFGMSRDRAMELPLMMGTCFGLDLRVAKSRVFLDRLHELATPGNLNGTHMSRLPELRAGATHPRPGTEGALFSSDERCWGHRSDEIIMGLLADQLGMATHDAVEFGGGDGHTSGQTCIRSGYDIPTT